VTSPVVAQVVNLCAFPIRIGLGAAHARRRTFTSALQAFALSMLTSLRHPWLRSSTTPAPGHGQPLAASRSTGFQPVCLPGSPWDRLSFWKREQRTHTPQVGRRPHSRRRRACLRPAAVPRRQATITCEPYGASAGRMPADARPGLFGTGWKPVLRTETPGSRLPGPWMARQPCIQNVRLSSAKTSRLS
jgi:hypothetical protein